MGRHWASGSLWRSQAAAAASTTPVDGEETREREGGRELTFLLLDAALGEDRVGLDLALGGAVGAHRDFLGVDLLRGLRDELLGRDGVVLLAEPPALAILRLLVERRVVVELGRAVGLRSVFSYFFLPFVQLKKSKTKFSTESH